MWSFQPTRPTSRPDRCAPVRCPSCGAWVDPYHPRDARTGDHVVANITKLGETIEAFAVTHCSRQRPTVTEDEE